MGVSVYGRQEDIANARIHFENGCIANLTASRVTPQRKRKIRIFQRDAYVSVDYIEQEVEIFRRVRTANPEPGQPAISIVRKKERIEKQEPLKLELAHFIECVQQNKEPLVTGELGRAVLEVIYAAYASAGQGKKISLPFSPVVKKPVDLWLNP